MNDWDLLTRVVGPMLTIGGTVIWWLTVISLQTPRRYWRDWLNLSIFGVLIALSIYVIARALVRLDWVSVDTQVIIMIGAVFAVMGWPQLAQETRRAWRSWRRDDMPKKGDGADG